MNTLYKIFLISKNEILIKAPVMVPAYPSEMIPQFSNSIMIPQQQILVDPGMIPPAAQGMPQAVFITEPMMGN